MIDSSIFNIDQVVNDMQAFWPSSRIDHRAVAIKYYNLVIKAVTQGIHWADAESIKLNLIPVSFKKIRDQLGRYGAKGSQKYWFDWFQINHPLMEPVIRGYSLPNKKYSLTMIKSTNELQRLLLLNTDQQLFDSYYQDLTADDLDVVAIDLDSLTAYLRHNQDTQQFAVNNKNHSEKLKHNAKTAELILRLAEYNNSQLPQIKVISDFGRKYYRGPNLQSAPKIVRHAALGDCYQYDIEASVFTWKFDMAKDCDPKIKLPETLEYLDYKQHHRQRLAQLLWGNTTEMSVSTIKSVITAVGFGARINSAATGWYSNGAWTTSAISDIVKSPELRQRLFDDCWFKAFVLEQDQINALIFDQVRNHVKGLEILQTTSGRLSKNKTISYLYQQAEAQIIRRLEQRLQAQGREILLLCHDGFYTKQRADLVDLRYELQQTLPHGRLDEQQHHAFKYNPDAVIEEQQHQAWIQHEEQLVAELLGKSLHRPQKLPILRNQHNEEYDSGYDDGSRSYQEPNYYVYDDEEYLIPENPDYINSLLPRP